MRLNILICIDSFYNGGAEMFVVHLSNALVKNHNVHILELDKFKSKNRILVNLLDENIKIYQPDNIVAIKVLKLLKRKVLPLSKGSLPHKFLIKVINRILEPLEYIYVYCYILRYRINIVHSNTWKSDHFMSKIYKRAKCFRFIITLHGHYELLKNKIPSFYFKLRDIYNSADSIVYLSSNNLRTFQILEVDHKRFHYINNGIQKNDGYENCNKKPGEIHFGIASRAVKEKGWEEAIKATIDLNNTSTQSVYLHLFGDGNYLQYLEKKYHQLKNIVFHGFVLNVVDKLKKMDVCMLPSHQEAMPFAVIEYLSIGKPVIATRVGHIEEMITVDQQLAGFLVDCNDGKVNQTQLFSFMRSYIEKPELIKRHSELTAKAFAKFDIEECVKKYLHLYAK